MSSIYKAIEPCTCGEYEIEIESDFVGYMGSRPCYEHYGKCRTCGERYNNSEIDERFELKPRGQNE